MAKHDDKDADQAPKKKGGAMKWVIIIVVTLIVIGGGVGGGLYAMQAGLFGGGHGEAAHIEMPRLVPKSEEIRGGGEEGGHGGGGSSGHHKPMGKGGDKYASNYYAMEKEFTSNLRESVHFIQVGIAISTPYDERVIENLKTHEIAVRSAVLLTLGEATEEQVFAVEGKRQMQAQLVKAVNAVLKQKEGFGGVGNVYFTNFVVQ